MPSSCALCSRKISDAGSLKTGLCASCQLKMEATIAEYRHRNQDVYLPYKAGDNVTLKREETHLVVNVPRVFTRHSPDGYEWGYTGSGPAELALNILLLFSDYHTANALYHEFKEEFIGDMPRAGGTISEPVIKAWLAMRDTPAEIV